MVLSGFQAVKEALVSNSEQFSGRPLTPFFQDLFGEKGEFALHMMDGNWLCMTAPKMARIDENCEQTGLF